MITQEVHLLAPSGIARLAKEKLLLMGLFLIPLFMKQRKST
jgi:hypothetical protein